MNFTNAYTLKHTGGGFSNAYVCNSLPNIKSISNLPSHNSQSSDAGVSLAFSQEGCRESGQLTLFYSCKS